MKSRSQNLHIVYLTIIHFKINLLSDEELQVDNTICSGISTSSSFLTS